MTYEPEYKALLPYLAEPRFSESHIIHLPVSLYRLCRPTYNELPPIVYIVKTEYMSGVSNHPEYECDDDDPDLSPFKEDFSICQMLMYCVRIVSRLSMKASIVPSMLEILGDAYQLKHQLTVRSKL